MVISSRLAMIKPPFQEIIQFLFIILSYFVLQLTCS
nr:MAG TPA: hypothetical protein [Caudoviricetes sp.]